MIRVDAHHHLWDPSRAEYPWLTDELAAINRAFSIEDLREVTNANEIDATVLVQTRSSEDETREFLTVDVPVVGVVGWVDLTAADVAERIAALRAGPGGERLVGIRHQVHDEPDENWLDRADVRAGIEAVSAASLTFDLLVRTRELPAATRCAAALPGTTFVLDHMAKPPLTTPADSDDMQAWRDALRDLAACPNVGAKVSGLVTEADWDTWSLGSLRPAIETAMDLFGPTRLLFGSDWPVCLLAAPYDAVDGAANALLEELSESEHELVFGGNAIEAYRLEHLVGRVSPT